MAIEQDVLTGLRVPGPHRQRLDQSDLGDR